MKILVACEMSGRVRDAIRANGHDAYSCDLLPDIANSPFHFVGDVIPWLDWGWDALIAFPPCTYLCVSGQHWNARRPERQALTEQAVLFFMSLANAPIERIAIENPIGIMSTRWRKPNQVIQPYEFGEDASKKTALWLKGFPLLVSTKRINGRMIEWPVGSGKTVERWSNQTDSNQNKLGPSADRAMIRSLTYQGIADAMAAQWFSSNPQKFEQG